MIRSDFITVLAGIPLTFGIYLLGKVEYITSDFLLYSFQAMMIAVSVLWIYKRGRLKSQSGTFIPSLVLLGLADLSYYYTIYYEKFGFNSYYSIIPSVLFSLCYLFATIGFFKKLGTSISRIWKEKYLLICSVVSLILIGKYELLPLQDTLMNDGLTIANIRHIITLPTNNQERPLVKRGQDQSHPFSFI